MLSSDELSVSLAGVVPPSLSGFSVRDLPSAPGYKIGKGVGGTVALLTPPDPMPEPPTRLRTLQLDPRITLSLELPNEAAHEAEHGLVQLVRDDDPELLGAFLAVATTLVRLIGPTPAPGVVSAGMRAMLRIFDPVLPARGSVLGLWAELLLIENSSQPSILTDAWHAHVDARFDFSAEGSRLEVKATTRDERIHTFNLRQLAPVVGADVVIASVMTTETGAGTSISDLVDRLGAALADDPTRQVKLHTQVAETLGRDWFTQLGRRFDERQAIESLALLSPGTIPQVGPAPPSVLEVRLTVDCSGVTHQRPTTGLGKLLSVV